METDKLKVPGEWLKCCGKGDKDRVFPVKRIYHHWVNGGTVPRTVIVVDDNGYEWTVIKELRNAEFV